MIFMTLMASMEASLVLLRHWTDSSPLSKAAAIAQIALFWFSAVWVTWAIVTLASRVKARWLKYTTNTILLCGAYIGALFYILSWVSYYYHGLFLDSAFLQVSWLKYLNPKIMLSTLPAATYMTSSLMLANVIGIPLLVRLSLKSSWDTRDSLRFRLSNSLFAILCMASMAIAVAFTSLENDESIRQNNLDFIFKKSNPISGFISNVIWPKTIEAEWPDLDTHDLVPLTNEKFGLPRKKYSILYLAVESLRSDLLFKSINGKDIMPNLNRFARQSAVFTNGYSQCNHTDYAIPSLLSGRYPLIGPTHHFYQQIDPWPKILIYDYLKSWDYTNAIITADQTFWGNMKEFMMSPSLSVFYDADNLPESKSSIGSNRGYIENKEITRNSPASEEEVVQYALAWLQTKKDVPFFLHTFMEETHFPYTTPAGTEASFQPCELENSVSFDGYPAAEVSNVRNRYYNSAHDVDKHLGMFFDYLRSTGLMDKTIVVIVGDHGEAFHEHGEVTHAGSPYQEQIRVPLIIFAPSVTPGICDYPAQQIDILPTICGLLGTKKPAAFQGIDLFSSQLPPESQRDLYIHYEVFSWSKGEALIHGNEWKFWTDRMKQKEALFNLIDDPLEKNNLIDAKPAVATRMRKMIQDWRHRQLEYYKFPIYYEHFFPPQTPVSSNW